eukprot:CAMPEP_0172034856 /NCGR_PEP_ID=MMETSP1041-20130122/21248_1 /TAXON_ID=464988 /ORGANISM="Hemiselmis andersenii, Strain CCMP439" /LENGTH=467 /DNA_ID=CAMNT_0012691835 /DNA_START=615 /DNA_END=2017 /DNA_ORIENTATION=-
MAQSLFQVARHLETEARAEPDSPKCSQRVIRQRPEGGEGGPDEARLHITHAQAREVLHTLCVYVVEESIDGKVPTLRVLEWRPYAHHGYPRVGIFLSAEVDKVKLKAHYACCCCLEVLGLVGVALDDPDRPHLVLAPRGFEVLLEVVSKVPPHLVIDSDVNAEEGRPMILSRTHPPATRSTHPSLHCLTTSINSAKRADSSGVSEIDNPGTAADSDIVFARLYGLATSPSIQVNLNPISISFQGVGLHFACVFFRHIATSYHSASDLLSSFLSLFLYDPLDYGVFARHHASSPVFYRSAHAALAAADSTTQHKNAPSLYEGKTSGVHLGRGNAVAGLRMSAEVGGCSGHPKIDAALRHKHPLFRKRYLLVFVAASFLTIFRSVLMNPIKFGTGLVLAPLSILANAFPVLLFLFFTPLSPFFFLVTVPTLLLFTTGLVLKLAYTLCLEVAIWLGRAELFVEFVIQPLS